jgi:hypothetical protein
MQLQLGHSIGIGRELDERWIFGKQERWGHRDGRKWQWGNGKQRRKLRQQWRIVHGDRRCDSL